MTTISVPIATLRNHLADVLSEVTDKKKTMVITKKGKAVAGIVDIELLEDLAALTSPSYIKSIKEAREDYKKGRVFTHTEVFGEV